VAVRWLAAILAAIIDSSEAILDGDGAGDDDVLDGVAAVGIVGNLRCLMGVVRLVLQADAVDLVASFAAASIWQS
jgi:hypothetical protein